MELLRGAVVGCGYISEQQFRAWRKVAGAEIIALCDLNKEKALSRSRQFSIPRVYTNHQEMLAETDLDFVDIATRPPAHLRLVTDAAAHNLHVLCQKPVSQTMCELEEMVSVCAQQNVTFMANENCRHQAWFRKIKDLLDSNAIGQPFYARITGRWRGSLPFPRFEKQPYIQNMPYALVYELGVHYLDTARYLFGEATSLYASLRCVSPYMAGEDLAVLVLHFGDLVFLLDSNWCALDDFEVSTSGKKISWCRVSIEGTDGTITLDYDGKLTARTESGVQCWKFPEDTIQRSFVATQQHFVDCVRTHVSPETDGENTARTMSLVFSSYSSASEGCVVHFDH